MNVGLDIKQRVSAGALALTLLLAGCATGAAYVRPTVDVPGAFKERPVGAAAAVPPPGWKPASPQDAQAHIGYSRCEPACSINSYAMTSNAGMRSYELLLIPLAWPRSTRNGPLSGNSDNLIG